MGDLSPVLDTSPIGQCPLPTDVAPWVSDGYVKLTKILVNRAIGGKNLCRNFGYTETFYDVFLVEERLVFEGFLVDKDNVLAYFGPRKYSLLNRLSITLFWGSAPNPA